MSQEQDDYQTVEPPELNFGERMAFALLQRMGFNPEVLKAYVQGYEARFQKLESDVAMLVEQNKELRSCLWENLKATGFVNQSLSRMEKALGVMLDPVPSPSCDTADVRAGHD